VRPAPEAHAKSYLYHSFYTKWWYGPFCFWSRSTWSRCIWQ